MSDEIIQEIWQIKDAIGRESNYNLHTLGALLRQRQRTGSKQVVDLSSKRKAVKKKFPTMTAEQSS